MDNINTQAKDEVRELLTELVVTPVTSDVKSIISSSFEAPLSELKENQNQKFLGLKGHILKEKNDLSKEFDNKLDDVSNSIEVLEHTSKNIKSKTESLDTKLSEVKENCQKICELTNEIKSQNAQHDINTENFCHTTISDISETIKTCKSETIDKIINSANSISADIKDISNEIQEYNSNVLLFKSELASLNSLIISSLVRVNKNQHALMVQLENKSEGVSNKLSVMTKSIDSGIESLIEQNNINVESFKHINKQNTRLFYVMLVLSLINSIGLLSILYFLINF